MSLSQKTEWRYECDELKNRGTLMKVKGTYVVTDDNYELEIYYEYYWDDGDYNNPPENDMEILEVSLNGMDITDFYWDLVRRFHTYKKSGNMHKKIKIIKHQLGLDKPHV